MSKHKRRRARREEYYQMLDQEVILEKGFINRVIGTLNHKGLDIAHDGNPIKADFWRFIRSRKKAAINTARAGENLVERAIGAVRVRNP